MILDNPKRQSVLTSWKSVRTYEAALDKVVDDPAISPGAATRPKGSGTVCYSLLVLFAVAVLEDALKLLRDKKVFLSELDRLIYMMDNSRTQLPWVDFQTVIAYRNRRNQIRYEQETLSNV